MYRIGFYRKKNGKTPVLDYMRELSTSNTKDSRIKLNKIAQYIKVLEEMGTRVGEPIVKHLHEEIWELRPSGDRILFAAVVNHTFVLLHSFHKKNAENTQVGNTASQERIGRLYRKER